MAGLGAVVLLIAAHIVSAQATTDCERRWPNAFCTYMTENRCPGGSRYTYDYCGYRKICCIPQETQVPPQSTCGKRMVSRSGDDGASRIVGGTVSYSGEWPWQVSLRYYGSHMCGGTIIDRHWILTAAHCFEDYNTVSAWTAVVGEFDSRSTSGRETRHRVSNIYTHRLYSDVTDNYDIAMMKVSTPIEYDNYVQPACLPDANDDFTHTMCTVTGWGAHYTDGPGVSRMEKVSLAIISNSMCTYKYGSRKIKDHHICAGHSAGGRDSCQGDSGGPLSCQTNGVWSVAGVVSWGADCGSAYYPGVYTRVSEMLDWIELVKRE